VEFKYEPVDAEDLIAKAADPLKVMLDTRSQTVKVNTQSGQGGQGEQGRQAGQGVQVGQAGQGGQRIIIHCDKTWSAEALTNIIKNAGEHSPAGGDILMTTGENPLYAWISVTDSGEGLTKEQLPHLFERFHSANKQGGIGIGLNMARTILRSQGGDIEVTLPNTFTLKLYK
jgi:signal transduction histidine kinase